MAIDLTEIAARQQVFAFLAGQMSLRKLQRWTAERIWASGQPQQLPPNSVQGAIELALAEYTAGDRDLSELRDLLGRLAETYEYNLDPQRAVRAASFTPSIIRDLVPA